MGLQVRALQEEGAKAKMSPQLLERESRLLNQVKLALVIWEGKMLILASEDILRHLG